MSAGLLSRGIEPHLPIVEETGVQKVFSYVILNISSPHSSTLFQPSVIVARDPLSGLVTILGGIAREILMRARPGLSEICRKSTVIVALNSGE